MYPYSVDSDGKNALIENKLLLTDSAWYNGSANATQCDVRKIGTLYKTTVSVPASATLNRKAVNINFYGNESAVTG